MRESDGRIPIVIRTGVSVVAMRASEPSLTVGVRIRFRVSLLAAFAFCLLAPAALAACGDDDSARPTPGPNALDDKQYLAVLCDGLTNYYVAINNKPDAAGISQVIKDYIASVQKV